MTNVADILEVGEKCFEDGLYQAAKLLFTSISNWSRIAATLIYLKENQADVERARKAENTQCVHFCKALSLAGFFQGIDSSFMLHVSSKMSSDSLVALATGEFSVSDLLNRHKFVV